MPNHNSRRRTSILAVLICTLLALLPHASYAAGGPRKLSNPSVISMRITPNSQRVVYIANNALYSIPASGGQAIQLSGPLANGYIFEPFDFQLSPDNSRVVYVAKQLGDVGAQLYSVPVTGGTPVKLKPAAVYTEDIGQYEITSDSRYIVFRTYHHGYPPTPGELFSAPIDGRAPAIKLSLPLASNQTVQDMAVSADRTRVVYGVGERRGDGQYSTLYSVPITGGASVSLGGPYPTQSTTTLFSITPDSSRVVYNAQQPDGQEKLYSVPLAGGTIVELSVPSGVSINPFVNLTRDSSRVVYQAIAADDNWYDLYSAPIAGGAAVKLNDAPISIGLDYEVSPDGMYVVYQPTDLLIYSVPVSGGSPKLISGAVGSAGAAVFTQLHISPDSSRVVYFGSRADYSPQLYSVPIDGSAAPMQISNHLLHGVISEREISFTPDSKYVLYRAEGNPSGYFKLYRAPSDGSGQVKQISGSVPITAGYPYIRDYNVYYQVSADSRFVLFLGAAGPEEPRALYIADLVEYRFSMYLPRLTR